MSTIESTGLRSFHRFLTKQLEDESSGNLSPEEALALWRAEQRSLAALREGLADIAAGRYLTLDEYDREFRQCHNLPDAP